MPKGNIDSAIDLIQENKIAKFTLEALKGNGNYKPFFDIVESVRNNGENGGELFYDVARAVTKFSELGIVETKDDSEIARYRLSEDGREALRRYNNNANGKSHPMLM